MISCWSNAVRIRDNTAVTRLISAALTPLYIFSIDRNGKTEIATFRVQRTNYAALGFFFRSVHCEHVGPWWFSPHPPITRNSAFDFSLPTFGGVGVFETHIRYTIERRCNYSENRRLFFSFLFCSSAIHICTHVKAYTISKYAYFVFRNN